MACELTLCDESASEWRQVRVEDVCETVSVGIVIQPTQYYVSADAGVRAFRSSNVGENKIIDRDWVYLSPEGHKKNAKSALQAGDVLVVRSGALAGTACVVSEDYAGSNCIDVVFARPKREYLIPQYLAEVTNSPVGCRHVADTKGGLAIGHFNVNAFKKLSVLIPSVQEQQRIVSLLSTWDGAIEGSARLIAAKEQHYIHELSRLISRAHHPRSNVGAFARELSERNWQGNERVLSVTNSRGFVLPEEQFARRVASSDLSNYKVVRRGQYAYNPSRINVGSIARLDEWDNGVLSPMYVVFEIDETKAESDYFLHWLASHEARQRIKNSAQGSVRETVSFNDFAAIHFPLPERKRQIRVAAYLNCLRDEIALLEQQTKQLSRQKRGLMQKLLTGEWSVPVAEEAIA